MATAAQAPDLASATTGLDPREGETGSRGLVIALLATPVVAGLLWLAVYLYADSLKAGDGSWMNGASDGWALAPLGTGLIVVCGIVLGLQLVLLLRALPDTLAGRWTEIVIAMSFGATVSVTIFWYLGLSTLEDLPDGFPGDPLCILGLAAGGLVTAVIPVVAAARRWRQHPPVGDPLQRRAQVQLGLVAAATALMVALPTVAEVTATPVLLVGLLLVPLLDVASRTPSPRR